MPTQQQVLVSLAEERSDGEQRRPDENRTVILIQAMVAGRGELIAGLLRDPILETLGCIGAARPEVLSIDVDPLALSGSEPVVVDALVGLEGDPS